MSLTLQEISDLVGGRLIGAGDTVVEGVNSLEDATPTDLAALEDQRLVERAAESKAGGLLIKEDLADAVSQPRVVVGFPQIALNQVIEKLGLAPPLPEPGVHETARVHPDASLGDEVSVGPYAVIGAGVEIGSRTIIHSHAVLEPGCRVGAGCQVHPHAVIGSRVRIGDDVMIGSAAVLGATGFGFGFGPKGAVRLHHLGVVEVDDRAEIGAGVTIDRARFGVTRIGVGTKLDSQVHVAHNCTIDDHTVLAAQVGLAGSSHVGKQCLIGGQAGIAGHLRISDGCQIGAKSGIPSDITEPGNYFGWYAKDRNSTFRELIAISKLPQALRELRQLKEEVQSLRDKQNS